LIRLFVAVDLPDGVRRECARLQAGLPGAKWVAPANLHLTLRFIGEVDYGRMADIEAGLGAIHAPAFALELSGVGYFGPVKHPRMLWAGVVKNPALKHLYDKIESAVVRAGCRPEPRNFKAHVTLARLKGTPATRLARFIEDHALFRTAPFTVTGFALYSSFLSASGAIHRREAAYGLGRFPGPAAESGEIVHGD